jgi:hypothetical protein
MFESLYLALSDTGQKLLRRPGRSWIPPDSSFGPPLWYDLVILC